MAQVVAAFYINMPTASITLCDGLGVKLRNFTKKKRLPSLIRAFPILFTESPPEPMGRPRTASRNTSDRFVSTIAHT